MGSFKDQFTHSQYLKNKEQKRISEELNSLKEKFEEKEKEKDVRISANQQLLILHYMGILDSFSFPTNEKKNELFHFIIDKNKQAVKEFFTYRNNRNSDKFKSSFNEKDLNVVLSHFQKVELIEFAEKVKSDMIELKF